jgi:nucleoside-diphosphate-sugar epimerase
MRFDLVVNLMTLTAFQKGRIIVMGGGMQWRPLVHVTDVSRAFTSVISSQKTNGEIYNIGHSNLQIKSVAYLVRDEIQTPVEIEIAPDDADKRDYNVSFEKIRKELDFECKTDISSGVREIYTALKEGKVDSGIKTVTVQWYKNILEARKLLDSVQLNNRII